MTTIISVENVCYLPPGAAQQQNCVVSGLRQHCVAVPQPRETLLMGHNAAPPSVFVAVDVK